MKFDRFLLLTILLCIACAGFAQGVGPLYQPILEKAWAAPKLEQNLRVLTDEIGGRVPGTPQMDRAINWARDAFHDAGADSVTTEEFTIPVGWAEGETRVQVVAPVQFALRARSIAWSPALAKPLRAAVVDVGEGSAEEFAKAGDLHGKIVLVHSGVLRTWDDLFAEYLAAPPVIARALKAGVAVIAWTATREHDILYRHINATDGRPDRPPSVLLAREDSLRVQRLLAAGRKVEMTIALPNRIGPAIKSRNVVAELRGSERPQEVVLLGAHLDSWELGTGALDNGCNAAMVIEVLRAMKAAGFRPRRTIRFVLFSGEEQGLLGSWAYVRQHRAEMDNYIAAVIFDEGTGRVTGYSLGGRTDIAERIAAIIKPFEVRGPMTTTADAFWGTDNLDFLLEGVPTLVANQVEANYLENYHATSDTYDKVDFFELKKNVGLAAVTVARLANEDRLGPRQTRAQIEELMRATHLDEQMKLFGMWGDWQSSKRGRQP